MPLLLGGINILMRFPAADSSSLRGPASADWRATASRNRRQQTTSMVAPPLEPSPSQTNPRPHRFPNRPCGNCFLSHKCLLPFLLVLLSGVRSTKPGIVRTFRWPRSAYIRHGSTQSEVYVISTSYEGKDDEGVSFPETPVSKNETQSQNLRLASAHRKPGDLSESDFCRA